MHMLSNTNSFVIPLRIKNIKTRYLIISNLNTSHENIMKPNYTNLTYSIYLHSAPGNLLPYKRLRIGIKISLRIVRPFLTMRVYLGNPQKTFCNLTV